MVHLVDKFQEISRKLVEKIGKKDVLNTDPAADIDARVVEVKISLSPQDSQRVSGLTNAKVMVEINTDQFSRKK